VDRALDTLRDLARSGEGNLLEAAVEAARARATVGEISGALEDVYTRYRATVQSVSGVYAAVEQGDPEYDRVCEEVRAFAEEEGRRPRMLVVKLGQDGHDRGMKVIATAFADIGFDVDVGPLFQTPEEAARQAIDNDVHVVGVSSQAAGHKTLVPLLVEALAAEGAENIAVVVGGVIPQQDYAFLHEHGVACVVGPGTPVPKAASEVLRVLRNRRR
jgi:methylmalonyl-CoA mutase